MTDFPSLPDEPRATSASSTCARSRPPICPRQIRAQTTLDHLYAIHAPTGQVLALVPDRAQAFVVARQNEFSPVSVH